MLAIDTNLIVRYLTGDEPRQAARARALIDTASVFVATTVLLECEWVLRSVYRFRPAEVARALSAFAGLPNVTLENPSRIAKALEWMKGGMDFADALHLAASEGCDAFVSLDESFVKSARAAGANARLA